MLRQGCRRSARLTQRIAAEASSRFNQGTRDVEVQDYDENAERTSAAASRKRRKQRPMTPQDCLVEKQQGHEQEESRAAARKSRLPALGSITNDPALRDALDAAAASCPNGSQPPAPVDRADTAAAGHLQEPTAPAQDLAACSGIEVGKRRSKAPLKQPSSKPGQGPSRAAEQRLWKQGYQAVAGVDEAGRGPLAGPVVAAAAVLPPNVEFELLNDSKQMTEQSREAVYEQLTSHPEVSYAIAVVDAATIDQVNILQAAMLAMRTAVEGLAAAGLKADHLLIDGNRKPSGLDDTPAQLVVKGDATVTCIAAASVLAKVTRDRLMLELDQKHPKYGFAQHKGYGVPAHKAAIREYGPCEQHRRSFEPIKTLTSWPGYPKPPPLAMGHVVAAVSRRAAASTAAAHL